MNYSFAFTDLLNVTAGMIESVQKRDHQSEAAIVVQSGIDQNLSQKIHTNAIQSKEMLGMSENVPKNDLGKEASGNPRVMHLNRRPEILSGVVHVNVQQHVDRRQKRSDAILQRTVEAEVIPEDDSGIMSVVIDVFTRIIRESVVRKYLWNVMRDIASVIHHVQYHVINVMYPHAHVGSIVHGRHIHVHALVRVHIRVPNLHIVITVGALLRPLKPINCASVL